MSLWIGYFCFFVSLCLTVVNSKVDLESQIRLAQCRATCLYKINTDMDSFTDDKCKTSKDCSQCWDSCELLLKNADSQRHCSQPDCNRGCREACRFRFLASVRNLTSPPPQPEETLHLHVSGAGVSWPSVVGSGPMVYVVLPAGLQTLDHHCKVPEGRTTRVLVVDRRGLVRVISPQLETTLSRVRTILRSLGVDLPSYHRRNNTAHRPTNDTFLEPWRLKVVSVTLESSLVLAQLSWPPQQKQLTYLVTWEVEGGIIRGNLLTNTTLVTLSLWPDTAYRIQVSIMDPDSTDSHSEPLVLDTHHLRAEQPMTQTGGREKSPRRGAETLLVVVGVTILLIVTLATTWRWRHHFSFPHSKLVDEEVGTPNIYRVFPPAVRLISENKKCFPEMYSSTDNLLQSN